MLIHGIDSNNKVVPLLLDASGNVIVSASQLTTTGGKLHIDSNGNIVIVGDTPYFTKPAQRNTFFSNITLPAGASNQTVLTVPAGETWRVSTVAMDYIGTAAGVTLTAFGYDSVNLWVVGVNNAPVTAQWVTFNFSMILEAGEQFLVSVTGATLNDDLLVSLIGERIY